jgi:lipopolysaccharide transport protein LptA
MTGAPQKISAVAAAMVLCVGLSAARLNLAFAQNESEPESTTIEEPQAEPTEFTPITAGDAERGTLATSPEAATPMAESTPAMSPTPAANPEEAAAPEATPSSSPAAMETPAGIPPRSNRSSISREPSRGGKKAAAETKSPKATTSPAESSASKRGDKSSTAIGGSQIVPENSPFGNFGNRKGPANITSDSGTLDYQNKVFQYTGHVHAVQAGGDLTCDTLKIQLGKDFNDIKMMYADGNVRMSQGTRWITSDHAVLDQTKHLLKFMGNPVVHDGEDQITGSLITVDLVTGKSTVEKPRMIIFPRESKNPDNVTSPDSP